MWKDTIHYITSKATASLCIVCAARFNFPFIFKISLLFLICNCMAIIFPISKKFPFDKTVGFILKFPFLMNQLVRLFIRWIYRIILLLIFMIWSWQTSWKCTSLCVKNANEIDLRLSSVVRLLLLWRKNSSHAHTHTHNLTDIKYKTIHRHRMIESAWIDSYHLSLLQLCVLLPLINYRDLI